MRIATWGRAPILALRGPMFVLALAAACKSKDDADKLAPAADVEIAGSNASANANAADTSGSSGSGAKGSAASGSGANGSAASGSGAKAANSEPTAWAALADLPHVDAVRVITIPTRPSLPRFTVGGPAIRGDIAVVSSSQFGFAAVDWRRGSLVWTKPAGIKVAPPVAIGDGFALIGDCVSPPEVPDGEMLLGCLRVVNADGTDLAYLAIHGKTDAVEPFAGAAGEQAVWREAPSAAMSGGSVPGGGFGAGLDAGASARPGAGPGAGASARPGAGPSAGASARPGAGPSAGPGAGPSARPGAGPSARPGPGPTAVAGKATRQTTKVADGEKLRWRRGDESVLVDPLSGSVTSERARSAGSRSESGSASLTWERREPPIVIEWNKHRWEIEQIGGKVVAMEKGKQAWATSREVTALLGAVWIPGQGPMVRMVNIGGFAGTPEVRILDMDATGSMNGTAAWTPVPGISMLGRAVSPVGDAVLAIRADTSIKHDFIAAYAASALLMYVFPLPEVLRPDPVGVAIALDEDGAAEAVVAFYDGDQVAVLPNVSAPPTAPGAAAAPLKKPTP
jgi:hypothetical protein